MNICSIAATDCVWFEDGECGEPGYYDCSFSVPSEHGADSPRSGCPVQGFVQPRGAGLGKDAALMGKRTVQPRAAGLNPGIDDRPRTATTTGSEEAR